MGLFYHLNYTTATHRFFDAYEQLANKCNLCRNAIYNYENNKRTPKLSTLIVIAKILNMPITDLSENKDNLTIKNEKINGYDLEMTDLYKKYF